LKINKKALIISALNALLLILIGVCLWRCHIYSNMLIGQQAAESWAGQSKERFAQVSSYFPIGSVVDENAIFSFRKNIDKKLAEAGLEPKTEGKYWTDAYSAASTLKVEGDRGSSDTTVVGVGGNFFLFHPYPLHSGSYIYDSDIMKDRVVLDYELAWKLFGGAELEGMTVKINGKPYYVAGVIQRETDKFSKKAFSGEPLIFMSYSALSELKEGTSISTYEFSMPDPISKFAKNIASENFTSSKAVVVENSSRYSFLNIYNIFKNFGSRSVVNNAVVYPYWENAARISEVYIARLYIIILLLAVVPFICFVILLVRLIKVIFVKLKLLGLMLWDAWDDRYARQKARQERKTKKQSEINLPVSKEVSEEKEEALAKNAVFMKLIETKLKLKGFTGIIMGKAKIKLKRKNKALIEKNKKQGKSMKAEQDNDIYNEKEISMDIESIVREILYENSGSGADGKN